MSLANYVMDTMFEESLFSDLSLAFYNAAVPSTMRFNVHRSMVSQSPYLRLLLNNTHRIKSVDNTPSPQTSAANDGTSQQQQSLGNHISRDNNVLHLTIDLVEAMTLRGFSMSPSQHIIRRQWQKSAHQSTASKTHMVHHSRHTTRHILSSHLRFVLKWLYSLDRTPFIKTLKDDDTLRVLCVAILFDLTSLVDTCLERYTTYQLSINTIVTDLETICQLPRDHKAYHQLRDAALLLLLRYGPDHPEQLAQLPVDYMADVLGADVLFIGCEYERYRLLREVLLAFMRSVGKITWTVTGPLDQDYKRLSGFVHNPMFTEKLHQRQSTQPTIVDGTSAQKRKRDTSPTPSDNPVVEHKQRRLSRLSFSSRIPFEQLAESASSGGIVDKATILSYLLRTTVNYSNMTFEQLSIVRLDGIVDEGIVFKALWQREALERLLFPYYHQQSQQAMDADSSTQKSQLGIPRFGMKTEHINSVMETTTVGSHQATEDRWGLLGAPQFRFSASVRLALPTAADHAGWRLSDMSNIGSTTTSVLGRTLSNQSSSQQMEPFENTGGEQDDDYNFDLDDDDVEAILNCDTMISTMTKETSFSDDSQHLYHQQLSSKIYSRTIYSDGKYILGHWHRVRVEAQLLPRSLLQIQDDKDDSGDGERQQDDDNNKDESSVLVCRFELQRNRSEKQLTSQQTQYHDTQPPSQDHSQTQNTQQPSATTTATTSTIANGSALGATLLPSQYPQPAQQQSKIRYAIYCLNQHEGLMKNRQVDREDRVLVPVSEVMESNDPGEPSTGYVGQVMLNTDSLENNRVIDVDMMIALEIFGFSKTRSQ